ncbi:hypothetical protein AXY43_23160 [Clostridium sp. MF28]|uniref:hypothetical protein n=1 Tax=Clostridium TaxID=1485 RepID=UPI000D21D00B|nr:MULTISPECIES: hypothetical protein [Clostridium]AVK50681.1 hypothetical protein AXY43_23160 [Clostridium sp. MF28]
MDYLNDAKVCLSVSSSMLKEIEKIYNDSLLQDSTPSTLKVTIKNFLENIRSSLEYITNYVFYTYCAKNYTETELKRKKVYFPIRKDKNYFDKCINKDFRGLHESNPEIYQILENCQAFNVQSTIIPTATATPYNNFLIMPHIPVLLFISPQFLASKIPVE